MLKENKYSRNASIINNRYRHYLLSTTLIAAAGSLNWFVDSFVVSFLLGSAAMSIVNMCNPITLIMSAISNCIGVGGSTIYAEILGKMNRKKAGIIFRYSVMVAVILSVIITIIGLLFLDKIAYLLCGGDSIFTEAIPYLRVMFISVLPIISIGVLSSFIIVAGKPHIATAVNIISNVVNICMDYVFIHFFKMKVEGAAIATLTGNLVAILIVFYYIFVNKSIKLEYNKELETDNKTITNIFYKGLSPALNQLGFSIKILVCNSIAMSIGGIAAVTVFSVCMQTVTVVTIVLGGTLNAMFPLLALLKGQKDYEGIRLFIKKVYIYQLIASIILVIVFITFSNNIMNVYNVPTEALTIGNYALKIFAISHIFRPVTMIFMYYAQTIDMRRYAYVISLIDGLVGVPLAALLLTKICGITGLWLTFPLVAALLLIGIIITNIYFSQKTDSEYDSILLLPKDDKYDVVFNATITENANDISEVVGALQKYCENNGCDDDVATKIAVACEEMCQYTVEIEGISKAYIDIIAHIHDGKVELNIRSIGKPLSHMSLRKDERYSNIYTLYKMASEVDYDYVMGMNQTRIVII